MNVRLDTIVRVLDVIHREGVASIYRISRVSGLSPASVHRAIHELLDLGLVVKNDGGYSIARDFLVYRGVIIVPFQGHLVFFNCPYFENCPARRGNSCEVDLRKCMLFRELPEALRNFLLEHVGDKEGT